MRISKVGVAVFVACIFLGSSLQAGLFHCILRKKITFVKASDQDFEMVFRTLRTVLEDNEKITEKQKIKCSR